jgi:hypothetical protein
MRTSLCLFFLVALTCAARSATIVSYPPVSGGGVMRWSQLWQDPGPGGNDLDGDAVSWADFTLSQPSSINHIEWWGNGACELGFKIEFWRQDPNTIAYQPLGVFYYGVEGEPIVEPEPPGFILATPTALPGPGGLTHYVYDLATPVSLAANDAANPRWFVGIIGLTHQAYVQWNWAQGTTATHHTFQFVRGDGNQFRSLGDGRALLLSNTTILDGDYNRDGNADAADYVVWRKTDGSQQGYDTWRSNFGNSAGGGSLAGGNAAVPEPSSAATLAIGALAILSIRFLSRWQWSDKAITFSNLLLLFAMCSYAQAEVINSYQDLEAILGDELMREDFEGLSLHGGTSIVVPNPLNSSTAPPAWGILPGLTYSSPDELALYAGQLLGDDSNILAARGNAALNILSIRFDNPQLAVGFYLANITGNLGYDETITFRRDGTALDTVSLTLPSSSELFMGRRFAAGITSIDVVSDAWALADNITWGTSVPGLAGDYNADLSVDAADYVVWRKGLGIAYAQSEFAVWRAHFGETPPYGGVPEPAGIALLLLGSALAGGWRGVPRPLRRVAQISRPTILQ